MPLKGELSPTSVGGVPGVGVLWKFRTLGLKVNPPAPSMAPLSSDTCARLWGAPSSAKPPPLATEKEGLLFVPKRTTLSLA